jgi:hypothetical protein
VSKQVIEAGPRALFLFPDEAPQSDAEVCSGRYRDWLGGQACPYSEGGRMPEPAELGPEHPCVVEHLGRLTDWRGEIALQFPVEVGARQLLKCKQMFLLVMVRLDE